MIDVKNAYIAHISLQKVGHKVREEATYLPIKHLNMMKVKKNN